MNGKPCTHCRVGWMKLILGIFNGSTYRYWFCDACGHSELCGQGEPAHE